MISYFFAVFNTLDLLKGKLIHFNKVFTIEILTNAGFGGIVITAVSTLGF